MRFIMATILACWALNGWADGEVALVKKVVGAPQVMHDGEVLAAKLGMKLYATDKLVAGVHETLGITFNDGTTISVGPSTELEMREYVFDPASTKFAFNLYLKRGTLVYSSGKLGKLAPSAVKLDTPRSTVGVRGTRLVLNYE